MCSPAISIITPTLNEAPRIEVLIEALHSLPGPQREVIVSDGGSSDKTVARARKAGALVVIGARGRGAQLNAGAQEAGGELLWFVHADTQVHSRSLQYLENCAKNSRLCGGNFRLRFEERCEGCKRRDWAAHLFARIARQQRRLGIYYGDSGIWVRREVFDRLNGFQAWPLFEDYDFARRLDTYARQNNKQTALAPYPITVSARRFRKRPLRVLRQWLWLQILFLCGTSPQKLAQIYRSRELQENQ